MLRAMRGILLVLLLFCELGSARKPDPDQVFKAAIDAQRQGNFPTAIRAYRKVLELRPDMIEAKVNLGAALVHEGKFDEAIAMYRSALPSVSQKNAVLMNIALAYYKKGDFENARTELEPLQKEQPNSVRIAVLLGGTYNHLRRPADTIALLEPLESANPQNLNLNMSWETHSLAMASGAMESCALRKLRKLGIAPKPIYWRVPRFCSLTNSTRPGTILRRAYA